MKQYKRGKKLTADIGSVRELHQVAGLMGELEQLKNNAGEPVLSKKYGTSLWKFSLADKDTGEISYFWADGGIRGALSMSRVAPGAFIEIVHTGEKEIDDGTIQTYDIYALE